MGHVTRSIKFVSGADEGWGYTVWVYQMWEGYTSRTGNAVLDSVEFTQGGQYDTQKATLNLFNNGDSSSGDTTITKSSFSFCRTFCLYAYMHHGAVIHDNLFYEGRNFHLKLQKIQGFTVTLNTLIAAISRPTLQASEPIACV